MSAERFIRLAVERGFLDQGTVEKLRAQLARGTAEISPDKLAQLLVQKQRMTMLQAGQLLQALQELEPIREAPELELIEDSDDSQDLTLLEPLEPETATSKVRERWNTGPGPLPPPIEVIADPIEVAPPRDRVWSAAMQPERPQDLLHDAAALSGTAPVLPSSRRGWWNQVTRLFSAGRGYRPVYRWDSKLMLLGGGGLAVLLLAAVLLYFLLTRGSGDAMLELAEKDYVGQAYSQSIAKYLKFLSRFGKHPKASWAQVRIGLARMRLNVEAQAWETALKTCQQELARIKTEPAFPEGRPELAGILPTVFEGFVRAAETATLAPEKQRLLDLAMETRALIDDPEILPASQRKAVQDRVEDLQDAVLLIQRDIRRDQDLKQTLAQIERSLQAPDPVAAYAARTELLRRYPGLEKNADLARITRRISLAERSQVGRVQTVAPTPPPGPSAVGQQVVLAHRESRRAGPSEETLFVAAQGAVYGISARDGRILWRYGVGAELTLGPQTIQSATSPDAVVVDPRNRELIRLDHARGTVRWRLPLGSPARHLQLHGDRGLLTTQDGRLIEADLTTGEARAVQVSPGLSTGPAWDHAAGLLYQPGEHSSLFILNAGELDCLGVTYVGHARNSIVVPPVLSQGGLFVFVNDGLDHCTLRAFSVKLDETNSLVAAEPAHRLEGRVVVPPAHFGNRVLVTTDRGSLYAFEMSQRDGILELRQVASTVASSPLPMSFFVTTRGEQIFEAGRVLAALRLQAAQGRLVRDWVRDDRAIYVAPPKVIGNQSLVLFSRRPQSDAITASCLPLNPESATTDLDWVTELGASPATEPIVDRSRKSIVVAARNGRVWDITPQDLQSGLVDRTVQVSDQRLPIERVLAFPGQPLRFTLADRSATWFVFKTSPNPGLNRVAISIPYQKLATPPVPWGKHLLVAVPQGFVYVVDPVTSAPVGLPFQPPMQPEQMYSWVSGTESGTTAEEFILAHEDGGVYALRLSTDSTKPELRAVREGRWPARIIGNLASIGGSCFALRALDRGFEVLRADLQTLAVEETVPFSEEIVWGPDRIDPETVLVATVSGKLFAWGPDGTLRWQIDPGFGSLAGRPYVENDLWWCSSREGRIWKMSSRTGEVIPWTANATEQTLNLQHPLASGPVPWGRNLLVLDRDGTLHIVDAGTPGPSPGQ